MSSYKKHFYLFNIHLFERSLEQFEIVDVFMLLFWIEFDSFELDYSCKLKRWMDLKGIFLIIVLLTGKKHVHELAVGGTGSHLLNLAHLGLEAAVDPG